MRDLSLGLLGLTGYGGGFNSLKFTVASGATTLASDTFSTLASAQTFFNDHAVNLGNFAAGSQTITVDYALTASAGAGRHARRRPASGDVGLGAGQQRVHGAELGPVDHRSRRHHRQPRLDAGRAAEPLNVRPAA